MFRPCTMSRDSILTEVEANLGLRRDYIHDYQTLFGRTYKTHTPTRKEWVAEDIVGDDDITIITDFSKMRSISWH